jgi:hypothetical protein
MLGSPRVAAQLEASQEGLSSMSEWVSYVKQRRHTYILNPDNFQRPLRNELSCSTCSQTVNKDVTWPARRPVRGAILKCEQIMEVSGLQNRNLLGFNAVQFEDSLTFRRNISLPSLGSMSKLSKKPAYHPSSTDSLLDLLFEPWRWRWYVPPKRRIISKLHGVTTQKKALSTTTAVRI